MSIDVYCKGRRRTHLAHVDAGHLVSLSVPVAELRHRGDGVQAGVLSQRGGDHLEGVGVRPHAVRLHARQGARVLCQTHGQLDLRSAAAGYQSPEGGGGGEVNKDKSITTQYGTLEGLVLKTWKDGNIALLLSCSNVTIT